MNKKKIKGYIINNLVATKLLDGELCLPVFETRKEALKFIKNHPYVDEISGISKVEIIIK